MKKTIISFLVLCMFCVCGTAVSASQFAYNRRYLSTDIIQGHTIYLDKSSLVLLEDNDTDVMFAFVALTVSPKGELVKYGPRITMKHNWIDPVNIVYEKANDGLWERRDMSIDAHYMWGTKRAFTNGYELLKGKKYLY